jgi:hypothetical protein
MDVAAVLPPDCVEHVVSIQIRSAGSAVHEIVCAGEFACVSARKLMCLLSYMIWSGLLIEEIPFIPYHLNFAPPSMIRRPGCVGHADEDGFAAQLPNKENK